MGFFFLNRYLPQSGPTKLFWHMHLSSPRKELHLPPFLQGKDEQGCSSNWQKAPQNPVIKNYDHQVTMLVLKLRCNLFSLYLWVLNWEFPKEIVRLSLKSTVQTISTEQIWQISTLCKEVMVNCPSESYLSYRKNNVP